MKNPARELAKKRWAGTTAAERKDAMAKLLKKRNRKLSKAQRSEIARKAAQVRWRKSNGDKE